MVFLVGLVREKIFQTFKKKKFFSLVCMNVLHQVNRKALCSMSVLKFG